MCVFHWLARDAVGHGVDRRVLVERLLLVLRARRLEVEDDVLERSRRHPGRTCRRDRRSSRRRPPVQRPALPTRRLDSRPQRRRTCSQPCPSSPLVRRALGWISARQPSAGARHAASGDPLIGHERLGSRPRRLSVPGSMADAARRTRLWRNARLLPVRWDLNPNTMTETDAAALPDDDAEAPFQAPALLRAPGPTPRTWRSTWRSGRSSTSGHAPSRHSGDCAAPIQVHHRPSWNGSRSSVRRACA